MPVGRLEMVDKPPGFGYSQVNVDEGVFNMKKVIRRYWLTGVFLLATIALLVWTLLGLQELRVFLEGVR